MNDYDVIVIGAGIGGLTAAALLAKRGLRVLVLEQHDKPGGCCQSWERVVHHRGQRLKFVFNAGVHDIWGIAANRGVGRLMRELEIEDAIQWKRNSLEYVVSDMRIRVPDSADEFCHRLCEFFPAERDGLVALFQELRVCHREMYANVESPSAPSVGQRMLRWANVPFADMLGTFLRDPFLCRLVLAISAYSTDNSASISTFNGLVLADRFFTGTHYPLSGPQTIADAVAGAVSRFGGEVRTRAPVSRVLVAGKRATGVVTEDGTTIESNLVVSNADVRRTFLELVGKEMLPADFARRIEALRPSCSCFAVFLGLDFVPLAADVTLLADVSPPLRLLLVQLTSA